MAATRPTRFGNFAIPVSTAFNSNGLKTIEVYTTDDAGAESNKVTLTFMVQATNIVPPPPTTAPPSPTLELSPSLSIVNGVPITSSTSPEITGTTVLGTFVTITETWENPPSGTPETMPPITLTGSDINSDGTFSFAFQDFTDSNGNSVPNGIFEVSATATYTQYSKLGASAPSNTFTGTLASGSASVTGVSSTAGLAAGEVVTGTGIPAGTTILSVNSSTSTVTLSANATTSGSENLLATVNFQIDNTPPPTATLFRLNPADDTGIVGDNVTTDRTPEFIGTAPAGDTVELFVTNQSGVQNTTVASSTTSTDANGESYNFAIQLPYTLNEGQTTLYVEVIDPAGNISKASSEVKVAITSTVVDYIPSTTADPTGGSTSDPALFIRNTATNQLQWLVQSPAGAASPWFGASGTPYASLPGTANVVPFDGDFDADGLTDLAYYNLSTATWTIDESSKYQPFVFTGTLTSGSASVTGVSNLTGLTVGQDVTGTGIPAGTTVLTINPLIATITLSANATASGSQSLTATVPPVSFTLGTPNASVPVVGNFDTNGNGPTEAAVFTINGQGQGVWTISSALNGAYTVTFGQTGDIPVPGDYGGIGYDQLAVYRPSTGQFLVYNPSTPNTPTIITDPRDQFLAGPQQPRPGPRPVLQCIGYTDYPAGSECSDLRPHRSGRLRPQDRGVHHPRPQQHRVYRLRVPTRRHPGPGRLPGHRRGPGGRLPAEHGSIHRGNRRLQWANDADDPRHLWSVGRHPRECPAVLSPAHQQRPHQQRFGWRLHEHRQFERQRRLVEHRVDRQRWLVEHRVNRQLDEQRRNRQLQLFVLVNLRFGATRAECAAPTPAPVSSSKHTKKVVTKKAHPKRTAKPKKTVKAHAKKETHTVKKVHAAPTVKHKAVVKTAVVTTGHASSRSHLVDLALEDVHVNLRRSNAKHHGA